MCGGGVCVGGGGPVPDVRLARVVEAAYDGVHGRAVHIGKQFAGERSAERAVGTRPVGCVTGITGIASIPTLTTTAASFL